MVAENPVESPVSPAPWVGIFDSGVGGLSVLRSLRRQRPDIPVRYVADSGHAPYGDREESHVVERSLRIADHLILQGTKLLIVACNTATAWAIEAIRRQHPEVKVVGVEPGIKPAASLSRNHIIGVMATPATLASPRFEALAQRHAAGCQVVPIPCPGLAAAIEHGRSAQPEVEALLDRFCRPLTLAGADTVVLGCTHYPFVATQIQQRLGDRVLLLDTADAVVRQALRLWDTPANTDHPGPVRLESTGHKHVLASLAQEGLGLEEPVEELRL